MKTSTYALVTLPGVTEARLLRFIRALHELYVCRDGHTKRFDVTVAVQEQKPKGARP